MQSLLYTHFFTISEWKGPGSIGKISGRVHLRLALGSPQPLDWRISHFPLPRLDDAGGNPPPLSPNLEHL